MFCPLTGRNVCSIKLIKSSLPNGFFILKHGIVILCRNIAVLWHETAILWHNITNASLLLHFIFRLELVMSQYGEDFLP